MSQVIYWQDSKVIESSNRKRRKYRVVCSTCGNERYLQKSDAKKALERDVCKTCSSREKGRKGYQVTVERYGKKFASRQLRQFHIDNPTSLERQAISILDSMSLSYEREHVIDMPIIEREFWYDFVIHDLTVKPILIEVDGDYWHNKPETLERDAKKERVALRQGFLFLRLAESEVANLEQRLTALVDNSLSLLI